MLWALEEASASMVGVVDLQDVLASIGDKLTPLGIQTVVLRRTTESELAVEYLSSPSRLVTMVERRIGISRRSFKIAYRGIEFYETVVDDRKACFVSNTEVIASRVLPGVPKMLVRFLLDRLGMAQMIGGPLVVDGEVWGALILSSNDLERDDVAAVGVFAHQVGWALQKGALLRRLQQTISEMESTQAQLVQAQKMEAVGRLTGGIAHDLNNLLTGILMSCELGRAELIEGHPADVELDTIERTTKRAARLIGQLLAFSRHQVLERRAVDMREVVRGLQPLLRRVIGEDLSLKTELGADTCSACVDVSQIEQVVLNLVVNARDAMPDGGELTLGVDKVVAGDVEGAPHDVAAETRLVRLTVADTGAGIDQATLPHIFDPFFTTKSRDRGTGLGLSTAYGILRQHEGWLTVKSEVGVGTRFDAWLPFSTERPSSDDDRQLATHGTAPQPSMRRVLLVEDEPELREILTRSLGRYKLELVVASTAGEGLQAFRDRRPDVVVSDLVLPDRNGMDLCGEIGVLDPRVGIVLVSGYTDRVVDLEALRSRGWVFLRKPFTAADLAQALELAVRR